MGFKVEMQRKLCSIIETIGLYNNFSFLRKSVFESLTIITLLCYNLKKHTEVTSMSRKSANKKMYQRLTMEKL